MSDNIPDKIAAWIIERSPIPFTLADLVSECELVNISPSTVRVHLSRARDILREQGKYLRPETLYFVVETNKEDNLNVAKRLWDLTKN